MADVQTEKTPLFYARFAGGLYLIIIVFGIFSEVFIRSNLVVSGDAAATSANIMAAQQLFRVGFAADAIMLLCDVAIAVLFYMLFKPVSNTLALAAAAFRLTQAAILGLNLLHYHAALLLLTGSEYAVGFGPNQLHALVLLLLDIHSHGYDLGLLFFGISNIILGYLIIKSDNFPSILGFGLTAAAVVYLVGSFIRFLLPGFVSLFAPAYIVPLLAELSFCLWLLIKGVKTK